MSGGDTDEWLADEVVCAAHALIGARDRRALLGIVGAPGAGKSTLAAALVRQLGCTAVNVPMDGFHLANRQLERLGLADRKGAPETFDADGYHALLARTRAACERGSTIYAPDFSRTLDEPVAGAVAIAPTTPLVITEGNYLLLDDPPWCELCECLDAVWYIDAPTHVREQGLVARHVHFGREPAEAWTWVATNDRPNARRIESSTRRADRRLVWDGTSMRFDDTAA